MAQAVTRWPLTAEVRVRTRVSPGEIWGGQVNTGTGFSPSPLVFPCQYLSTEALHTHVPYNIWGTNNRPARLWSQFRDMVSPRRHEQ
jgi:hypothetical protein